MSTVYCFVCITVAFQNELENLRTYGIQWPESACLNGKFYCYRRQQLQIYQGSRAEGAYIYPFSILMCSSAMYHMTKWLPENHSCSQWAGEMISIALNGASKLSKKYTWKYIQITLSYPVLLLYYNHKFEVQAMTSSRMMSWRYLASFSSSFHLSRR